MASGSGDYVGGGLRESYTLSYRLCKGVTFMLGVAIALAWLAFPLGGIGTAYLIYSYVGDMRDAVREDLVARGISTTLLGGSPRLIFGLESEQHYRQSYDTLGNIYDASIVSGVMTILYVVVFVVYINVPRRAILHPVLHSCWILFLSIAAASSVFLVACIAGTYAGTDILTYVRLVASERIESDVHTRALYLSVFGVCSIVFCIVSSAAFTSSAMFFAIFDTRGRRVVLSVLDLHKLMETGEADQEYVQEPEPEPEQVSGHSSSSAPKTKKNRRTNKIHTGETIVETLML